MFKSGAWKAGDKFKLVVKYNWKNGVDVQAPSSDYTVSSYSLQTLEIYDSVDDEDDANYLNRKTN